MKFEFEINKLDMLDGKKIYWSSNLGQAIEEVISNALEDAMCIKVKKFRKVEVDE